MGRKDHIEPKVWFANERTLLNWVKTSVLISTIGLALMNLGPSTKSARWAKLAGVMLVPISLVFLAYSLHIFLWRNELMRNKDPGPYGTKYGPAVLTGVFVVALVLDYIIMFVENTSIPS
eukprot:comp19366_c0_seq1/m.22319 comp19366_c0_seq1/g.22319  ORF comp19366_c0_seq1/g.22319 comp19366_c0_seq1/m.22319 type:complete len:120 (-) comp19366_c0_seq1:394-753(-)